MTFHVHASLICDSCGAIRGVLLTRDGGFAGISDKKPLVGWSFTANADSGRLDDGTARCDACVQRGAAERSVRVSVGGDGQRRGDTDLATVGQLRAVSEKLDALIDVFPQVLFKVSEALETDSIAKASQVSALGDQIAQMHQAIHIMAKRIAELRAIADSNP